MHKVLLLYNCMQAYRSISKCIAVICEAVPSQTAATVDKFVMDVKNEKSSDSVRLLCLLSMGEIGRKK